MLEVRRHKHFNSVTDWPAFSVSWKVSWQTELTSHEQLLSISVSMVEMQSLMELWQSETHSWPFVKVPVWCKYHLKEATTLPLVCVCVYVICHLFISVSSFFLHYISMVLVGKHLQFILLAGSKKSVMLLQRRRSLLWEALWVCTMLWQRKAGVWRINWNKQGHDRWELKGYFPGTSTATL